MGVFNDIFSGMARGFAFGMFGMNPFWGSSCWCNVNPLYYVSNPFMGGGFFPIMPQISMPIFDMTTLSGSYQGFQTNFVMPQLKFSDFDKIYSNNNNNYSVFSGYSVGSPPGDTYTPSARRDDAETDDDSRFASKPTSADFDKMLKFILAAEGGYNPNDCGQPGNKGILQSTYDVYRTKRGMSKKNVKNITDQEVKECYYEDFYLACGADKIPNKKLALQVFDAAVNMGVGTAKRLYSASGNSVKKFVELRNKEYNAIVARHPEKRKYLKNWKNRVVSVNSFADKNLIA